MYLVPIQGDQARAAGNRRGGARTVPQRRGLRTSDCAGIAGRVSRGLHWATTASKGPYIKGDASHALATMRPMLTWQDDERFEVGDTTFRAMPAARVLRSPSSGPRPSVPWRRGISSSPNRDSGSRVTSSCWIAFDRSESSSSASISAAAPRSSPRSCARTAWSRSTADQVHPLLAEYLTRGAQRLRRHVRRSRPRGRRQARRDRRRGVRRGADRPRRRRLLAPVQASRASFNELFPRLRPGGVYVIEDWPWAHAPVGTERRPSRGLRAWCR